MKPIFGWLKSILDKPKSYLQFRRFPVFKDLDSYELYLLNNVMHSRTFKAGDVIYEAGFPLEVIYFIEKGEIELKGKLHQAGNDVLGKNQYLGLIDLFHETLRSSTALAKTEVSAFAISQTDLLELIHSRPRTGLKILSAACRDFSKLIFQLTEKGI